MLTKRTPEDIETVRSLCDVLPHTTPAQAKLAAMIAEAFINGMNAREILTCDSAAAQPQK